MAKLRLPIIEGALPGSKILSMRDYLEFVNFNLKYNLDRKTARKQRKLAAVNIPFSLK